MMDKTLDNSLRIATTNTGIDEGIICQRSFAHKHDTNRDFWQIAICSCVIILMTSSLIFPFELQIS